MKGEVHEQCLHQHLCQLNAAGLQRIISAAAGTASYWLSRPSKAQQYSHMSIVLKTRQDHIKLHLLHIDTPTASLSIAQ